MRIQKLIYFLILVVTFSCSKKNEFYTIVKGTVSNAENDALIEGYNLTIRESPATLFSWSSNLVVLTSDNKGEFEYSFEARKDYVYHIVSVDNPNYSEIIVTSIVVGKTNEFNFKVNPDDSK